MPGILERFRALFRRKKISVVVPVLNEGKTIGNVVRLAKRSKHVDEVIVVDDNSSDDTWTEAEKAGARLLKSAVLGKGYSMKEGLDAARNPVIVYIDGDIDNYETDVIRTLTDPILRGGCDFVKATFAREAGRVTELVAKPLLGILFPELARFSQPLSGMIAARRDFLERLEFENDYGVDIGLLIDMHVLGARIKEVDIGMIENKSKPWQALGKMSREVSRAILRRAGKSTTPDVGDLEAIGAVQEAMAQAAAETRKREGRLAVFTVRGVVFAEADLEAAIARISGGESLEALLRGNGDFAARAVQAARLLAGVRAEVLERELDALAPDRDIVALAAELRGRGYTIGVIHDGFDAVAERARAALGADFALAHRLEAAEGVYTGEVLIPSVFAASVGFPGLGQCRHSFCASRAFAAAAEARDADPRASIAVASARWEACLLASAGIGIDYGSGKGFLDALAERSAKRKAIKELLSRAAPVPRAP